MSLHYLAAPYSNMSDKNGFMESLMKLSGDFMLKHPGEFIVSPLFNHYSLAHCPEMGSDWKFWKDYSLSLLSRLRRSSGDSLIVIDIPESLKSVGVLEEIKLAKEWGIFVEYINPSTLEIFDASMYSDITRLEKLNAMALEQSSKSKLVYSTDSGHMIMVPVK